MKTEFYGRGYNYEEYKVYNCENMTDNEIINKCDPNNFGGCVYRYSDCVIAKIYID